MPTGISDDPWLKPDWFLPAGVEAFFSSRNGGVSTGDYCSNNMGLHVGDDPRRVALNRSTLPSQSVGWLNQVHGNRCVSLPTKETAPDADASVTRQPGLVCAVMTADCLPVLMCDKAGTVVSAVHAGWRGLLAGVIQNAVQMMNADGSDIQAWIGPAISVTCFEVGGEVVDAFSHFPQVQQKNTTTGAWHIDLPLAAQIVLENAGVKHVTQSGLCTYRDRDRFFSHRRSTHEGRTTTGRMVTGIALKKAI